MLFQRFRWFRIITFLGDVLLLFICFFLFLIFSSEHNWIEENFTKKYLFLLSLSWSYISISSGLYNLNRIERFEESFNKLTQSIALQTLILFLILFASNSNRDNYFSVVYIMLLFSLTVFTWHFILTFILKNIRNSDTHFRKAVVIGDTETGREFNNVIITHKGYGYKSLGLFDDSRLNETIEDAKNKIRNNEAEDVFFALAISNSELLSELIDLCERNFVAFKIVPDLNATFQRKLTIENMGLMPVITLGDHPLNNYFNLIIKRVLDVVISLLIVVFIFTWLFPLISLMIKLNSKGSVFYFQKRSGINNKIFNIIKFRTMYVSETDDEFQQVKSNDSRVTRVGKVLRKFNLDELPQIFNIIIGNMSLVGPRPHPLKLNDEHELFIDRYLSRHKVKPGLTGLAQVRGFRGNTQSRTLMEKRIQADLFYIENWSFWLDIKIISLTFWNMIKGDKNAY